MHPDTRRFPPGLWRALTWLLWGDFILVLMEQVMPSLFPLMLKDNHASNTAIGYIMGTIPGVLGFAVGPILSYKSDRCRSRFGRRVPFMVAALPFIVGVLCLIPFAPELTQALVRTGWGLKALTWGLPVAPVLVSFTLLYTLYTIFNAICASPYSWLLVDVVPQAYMGRFMSLMRVFTLCASFAFNYFVMGLAERHLHAVFVGVAIAYGLGFGIVCWRVREPPLPPQPPARPSAPWYDGAREILVRCFTKQIYLWIYLAMMLYGWAALSGNLFDILFMRDTLGMNLATLGKIRAWTSILVIPLSYVFGTLVDRWRPAVAIMPALAIYAAGKLACFFFIHSATSYFVWTLLTNVAAYFWGVTAAAYLPTLLPREDYGQFSTALGLVSGISLLFMNPFCGWCFDQWKDYRYVYVWTVVFMLLGVLAFWRLYFLWKRHGGPDNYQAP